MSTVLCSNTKSELEPLRQADNELASQPKITVRFGNANDKRWGSTRWLSSASREEGAADRGFV
jgi:hypothetical protein